MVQPSSSSASGMKATASRSLEDTNIGSCACMVMKHVILLLLFNEENVASLINCLMQKTITNFLPLMLISIIVQAELNCDEGEMRSIWKSILVSNIFIFKSPDVS